jgi:spermidine synthase
MLNIVVGCAAWLVATAWPHSAMLAERPVVGRATPGADSLSALHSSLTIAALSGVAALGYQMIWVRAVALNTADTIFGFGATVSAYLAGIALGARFLADRPLKGRGWSYLATCQWGLAVFALLSPFVIRLLFGFAGDLASSKPAAALARQWLLVLVALLVPTTLMGASLALAFRLHRQDLPGRESASGIGAVYASNTVGAIAGSLITGMLLIPMLGTVAALAVLAGFNLLAALVAATQARARSQGRGGRLQQLLSVGVVGLALWVGLTSATTFHARPRGTLVFAREDASGIVEVVETEGVLTLVANRVHTWGSTAPENVDSSKRQGYLPLFLHPQPRRVIEVGLATGVASAPFLADPRVEDLVVVEISPAIVEASGLFDRDNGGITRHPKARVVVDDGRSYLMHADERFDLIVLGLFTPYSPWAGLLFSRELYAAARERLRPGGILIQWLPLQQLSPAALRSIVASFQAVYPAAHAWEKGQYLALVGAAGDLRIGAETLAEIRSNPRLRAEATRIGFGSPAELLATYLTGPRGLQTLSAGAPMNTDDRPLVEWSPVDASPERLTLLVENLTALLEVRSLDEQPVGNLSDSDRSELARAFEAREHSLRGAMHEVQRDYDRALQSYRRALALYPRDEIATTQIEKYTSAERAARRASEPPP